MNNIIIVGDNLHSQANKEDNFNIIESIIRSKEKDNSEIKCINKYKIVTENKTYYLVETKQLGSSCGVRCIRTYIQEKYYNNNSVRNICMSLMFGNVDDLENNYIKF